MNKSEQFKKILPDLAVIVAFILISFVYFMPAIIEGRGIMQHDSLAAIGQGQEQRDFMARHNGERTRWNLSMFSGMPSDQMSPTYDSSKPQEFARKAYSLFLPKYVHLVFIMLLGFYILMRAFKASPLVSGLGAVVWAFSSYFFILIAAGHIWKFYTLAYIPPTIAGMVYIYQRKKYLLGALLMMIFVAFQIVSNHVQMSYYFLFAMLFMVIGYFVNALKNKTLPDFFRSTGVVIIAGLIGVMANASTLYHTWEYSQQTMRGKSELSHHGDNATSGGLERDYITAWSYGIGETWTLLIPNTKGGSSAIPMSQSERAMSKARPEYRDIFSGIPQYWGEQPMTKGPVYVGAFVMTLFILGLFVVKGSMKWALLAGTIFSILLSWGHNFMPLTDFFIDHVPLYNKFRTVSSILVVAQFCIPLLAILALKEIIEKPEILKQNPKYLYISLGLTGGFALLFAIAPRMFFTSFVSTSEMWQLQQFPAEHLQPFISNLTEMRIAIFTADAWRSFFICVIGAALLWLYINKKVEAMWVVGGILVLCLVDMWGVNKRYLNDYDFQTLVNPQMLEPSHTDQYILDDPTLNFRVLNMQNPFNDGVTPFWHKTIGGYHAAKLRRYQDLIDIHLVHELRALQEEIINHSGVLDSANYNAFPVLNMLNLKWIIFPIQGGTLPIENPHHQGNAWFVDEIRFVDSADEEITALGEIDLRTQAVADRRFAPILEGFNVTPRDSASTIELISYDSNIMTYKVSAKKDELAVFSEIYYPRGWKITIDGKPTKMLRVNYTLRGLPIPAGEHTVVFKFDPQSIKVTDTIAYTALLLMLICGGLLIWRRFGFAQRPKTS
jgi:hypothetical protein